MQAQPRYHVLLDLDNTLICSVTEPLSLEQAAQCAELEMYVMDESVFHVYERPGLQEFLDTLFAEFRVSVWTAASKNYAAFIIDKFILKKKRPGRQLEYVFVMNHCNISKQRFKNNNKFLALLWHDFGLKEAFHPDRCVLLDDLVDWAADQPNHVINIKAFEVTDVGAADDMEFTTALAQLRELASTASTAANASTADSDGDLSGCGTACEALQHIGTQDDSPACALVADTDTVPEPDADPVPDPADSHDDYDASELLDSFWSAKGGANEIEELVSKDLERHPDWKRFFD